MLANIGGTLALLLGLLLLLLPLLANELSRPRDSVWGAVVLLLGLVLVTSADRLKGAPMLAVLCGGLLIGRLSSEVGLGRWHQLSKEEQQLLGSSERWSSSFQQLGASSSSLLQRASGLFSGLAELTSQRVQRPASGKLWVRPELPEAIQQTEPPQVARPKDDDATEPAGDNATEPRTLIVRDFEEITALLAAAPTPESGPSEQG